MAQKIAGLEKKEQINSQYKIKNFVQAAQKK
jgi:hypothetical protein